MKLHKAPFTTWLKLSQRQMTVSNRPRKEPRKTFIAEFLTFRREEKHWQLTHAAKVTEATVTQISYWELSKKEPTKEQLDSYLKHLELGATLPGYNANMGKSPIRGWPKWAKGSLEEAFRGRRFDDDGMNLVYKKNKPGNDVPALLR